uniref:Uncharacterized protein n=1 Tax=Opuntia streptacantha TaxID=393608 RepID=A0A7C9EC65_OPUST
MDIYERRENAAAGCGISRSSNFIIPLNSCIDFISKASGKMKCTCVVAENMYSMPLQPSSAMRFNFIVLPGGKPSPRLVITHWRSFSSSMSQGTTNFSLRKSTLIISIALSYASSIFLDVTKFRNPS